MTDDSFREEINKVCSECLEDIKFLKQQQWRIAYYTLLLFVVIFFLVQFLIYDYENPLIYYKEYFKRILFGLSLGIALVGLYFLVDFQSSLQKNRMYIAKIRCRYFRKETRKIFKLDEQNDIDEYCDFWKDWAYLITFSIVIILAFGLILFMIFQSLWWMLVLILPVIFFFYLCNKKKININSNRN